MEMLHHKQTFGRARDFFLCRRRRGMAFVVLSMGLPLAPLAAAIEKPLGAAGHQSETRTQIIELDVGRLTVSAIHGRAFNLKEDGGLFPLRRGGLISANQPVKVGPKSGLDLRTRDGGTLELGPDAELVLHPPGRTGDVDAMTTALRLNDGYLKVALKAPRTGRFNVSFGRWVAELKPGAYVFETRHGESSVCMMDGEMRLSDAQNSSTVPEPYSCVQLTEQAAQPMRLTGAEWADMDTHRVVNPILSEVSRRDRDKELDRQEARRAANQAPVVPMRPERDDAASLVATAPTADDTPAPSPTLPAPASAPVPQPPAPPIAPLEDVMRSLDWDAAPEHMPSAGMASAHDPISVPPEATPQVALADEPDATARETSSLEWIVNVATHSSLESAEFQAAQLRTRNLPASIRRETVRGRTAYRVVVDGLATEQAANGVVRTLVSDLGVRQAWVFRKH